MAKLLLNLRHVPDDEADDVRRMLTEHRIAFYETDPGRWWISAGGIWVRHDSDVPEAKRLMADYQAGRAQRARAEHEQAVREGRAETFGDVWRRDPVRVLTVFAGMILILGLMALPVFLLFR